MKNKPDRLFFQIVSFFQKAYRLSARKIPEIFGHLAGGHAGGGPRQGGTGRDRNGQTATKRAEKAGTF
ncbi:hypothetical protein A7X67_06245 [Clostridium sp. W14A]|nr:hypothetical protein A7X67_06245 [Clostridium sp. W14A]